MQDHKLYLQHYIISACRIQVSLACRLKFSDECRSDAVQPFQKYSIIAFLALHDVFVVRVGISDVDWHKTISWFVLGGFN